MRVFEGSGGEGGGEGDGGGDDGVGVGGEGDDGGDVGYAADIYIPLYGGSASHSSNLFLRYEARASVRNHESKDIEE